MERAGLMGPARMAIACAALLALAPAHAATAATPPQGARTTSLVELSGAIQALAERVGPSVVQVVVTRYGTDESSGASILAKQRSTGAGVILGEDGYVVTNAHVVKGARRVQVALPARSADGQRSILKDPGRKVGGVIVGIDTETDLAVLKIAEKGLTPLTLGDSEALRQGQIVMAFGSPLGLDDSASLGVVSAVARQLEPDSPMIYVQTDAPINPGNSGGPLVDVEGRVVGINTLILSQSGGNEGLGFAVPSNIVKSVFEQIRASGRVRRAEIGARTQTITPALAAGLGLARARGVLVSDVEPGSGAAEGGLEAGDVILALDGKGMENARQFEVNLYRRSPGGSVALDVLRGDRPLKLVTPVSERPNEADTLKLMVSPEANLVPRLGILALDLDDGVRRLLPSARGQAGVVVAAVTDEGPAWPEPPEVGDVIYEVNRRSVTSITGLRAAVSPLQVGDAMVLRVERRGRLMFLAAEVE